jgi:hypothetical protein
MPPVMAVAPLRSILGIERLKMAIDRRRRLQLDDLGEGRPRGWAIVHIPFQALRLHRLQDLKRHR